ncbi:MAG TPA: VOC family protein [Planctomycetota bacterium]|nr:VOC family protein [Planctomycetota bacterium]
MDQAKPLPGSVGWVDLTVDHAPAARDFYANVVGWRAEPVDMGDYADFNMSDAAGTPRAGVCHRRDANAKLPAVWMVYFVVPDLAASVERACSLGADIVDGPRSKLCVLRDPHGAVFALYQA